MFNMTINAIVIQKRSNSRKGFRVFFYDANEHQLTNLNAKGIQPQKKRHLLLRTRPAHMKKKRIACRKKNGIYI